MIILNEIIPIGSDHAGFNMKEFLKLNLGTEGYRFRDYGATSEEPVNYPDIIHPLAKDVNDGKYQRVIIMCGSGNGAALTANKYNKIQAAICWETELVKLARLHNDANILVLPARFISNKMALKFARIFLTTQFEGGRHLRRVNKISDKL